MTSPVHKALHCCRFSGLVSGWILVATAMFFDFSFGGAASADSGSPASSPAVQKVRLVEEGTFTSLKGNAQGVPLRLRDRSVELPSAESGVGWRGLSPDRLQWRFAPETIKGFADSSRARTAENAQSAELPFIRTVRFEVAQSKDSPQLEALKVCKGASTNAESGAGCTDVPLKTLQSPFQVIALPGQAQLPLVFRSGHQLCLNDFSSCSFTLSSWRLAQELTGYSDGGRDLPDLMWLEPHAKGTLALYDLRQSAHWSTIELPDSLGQRLGTFRGATVTDNRVVVADFTSGSLLLDFVGDTCRLLLPGEIWSCKEGLGASVVRDWLNGRYAAPSQEKKPGFSARAANWKLTLQQIGSEQLRAGLDGTLPLAQSLDLALFQKTQITFRGGTEIARWEPVPFELEQGFVVHRRDQADGTQFDWGGFGAAHGGDGIASAGASYRSTLWRKGQTPSFKDLVLPQAIRGLPLRPASDGVYISTGAGLKYLSGSELKNTSIESDSSNVNLLGPDESLVRRGSGGTCEMVHLVSHRNFPASFLESGLVLPCGTSWRVSTGFHGSVLAAWNNSAKRWLVRWLN